ncbi:glycine betaine ABC transporter substrate-binding protein [Nesterenkonia marinintestina]|uniref:glycine betaine ABC transporter substrate-binding protein n=1 Tax=Nesterenkonia marinintestina TaxID=2979865 RepID=UPI0021C12435|nr:glycine betaine ABC transporter substrate-binding protein [Nesterenkonia sp. GX14115]
MTSSGSATVRAAAARTAGALFVSSCVLTACGGPPSGSEPTGDEAEDAWQIGVGSDPVDQAVAYAYSLALNSRDSPSVVEVDEGSSAALAAGLADGSEGAADLVVSRTLPLAEEVAPEDFADLAEPDGGTAAATVTSEDLTTLIDDALDGASLLDPSAGLLDSALVITGVGAELQGVDPSGAEDAESFADACDGLSIGVDESLPDLEERLEEAYGCTPSELVTAEPDDLIDQLITAELDGVVVSSSSPQIVDYALVVVEDSRGAFPTEQYVPVAEDSIAEDVPDVASEVSESLDQEALTLMRRLLDGPDGLAPEEAAEYWLVEEEIIAAPDGWD